MAFASLKFAQHGIIFVNHGNTPINLFFLPTSERLARFSRVIWGEFFNPNATTKPPSLGFAAMDGLTFVLRRVQRVEKDTKKPG